MLTAWLNDPESATQVAIIALIVATIAAALTAWQIVRDILQQGRQARARARSAKLIIGAAYASMATDIRALSRLCASADQPNSQIQEHAGRLCADLRLANIYTALIAIDPAGLPDGAHRPVTKAQESIVALFNILAMLASGRRSEGDGPRLEKLTRGGLLSSFETMRSYVPFEVDPTNMD